MRKVKQSSFLILIAFVLLISNTAFGYQDGFFKFKVDCEIEIVGEPKIHEPFEAVFIFTPLEELVHTRGILDSAKFSSREHIKYVKGDTLWVGLLENGKTYKLRAWFVVDDPVFFRVQGSVRTKGATGIAGHKKGTPDPGANATNGKGSKLFDFKQPYTRKPEDIHYLSDDSMSWIAPFHINDSMLRDFGPAPVIAKSVGDLKMRKKHKRPLPERKTNYIFLDSSNLINRTAIQLIRGKTNIIKFDDRDGLIEFPKSNNTFSIIKLRENEYKIFPKAVDTLLNVQYKYSLYKLIMNHSSSDNK